MGKKNSTKSSRKLVPQKEVENRKGKIGIMGGNFFSFKKGASVLQRGAAGPGRGGGSRSPALRCLTWELYWEDTGFTREGFPPL